MTLIFWLFVGSTLIQIAFWGGLFTQFAFYKKPKNSPKKEESVSIIICARNEEKNLKKNLSRILNQNYRSFEVIVVNDASTDDTKNILLDFNIEYPNLRIVTIDQKPKKSLGKKHALSKGIDTAKHDVLLLTDADCRPSSNNWLRKMQGSLQGAVDIGLGYGPYERSNSWLNKFIRFETVLTAVQYFSYALVGLAYMGVGRNLIYRKSLFKRVGQFNTHLHVTSGDDDLFIREAAKLSRVNIIIDSDAFMYSPPKTSWTAYQQQKNRHYTTSRFYRPIHQFLLGLFASSHLLHFIGGSVLLFNFSTMFVTLFLYGVRILVVMIVLHFALKQLKESDLWYWVPILDIALVIHYLVFAPGLLTSKTRKW